MKAKVVMKDVRMWKSRLFWRVLLVGLDGCRGGTYSWDTVGHGVEGEGGDTHDDGDDPAVG